MRYHTTTLNYTRSQSVNGIEQQAHEQRHAEQLLLFEQLEQTLGCFVEPLLVTAVDHEDLRTFNAVAVP